MGDLSAHFSRAEFDCHDGAMANPHPNLLAALENLRTIIGNRPIRIVSGYRSPAWNKRVGGATRSQHLVNAAADIPSGIATVDQALAAGFTGVGWCGSWAVHVDVRPAAKPVLFHDC